MILPNGNYVITRDKLKRLLAGMPVYLMPDSGVFISLDRNIGLREVNIVMSEVLHEAHPRDFQRLCQGDKIGD